MTDNAALAALSCLALVLAAWRSFSSFSVIADFLRITFPVAESLLGSWW